MSTHTSPYLLGSAWPSPARLGSDRLGPSWPGPARLGLSWPRSARLGLALLRHWPAQARVLIANIIKNNQKQRLLQKLRRRKIQTTEAENSGVGLARLHLGSLRLRSTRPGLRLGSARLGLALLGTAIRIFQNTTEIKYKRATHIWHVEREYIPPPPRPGIQSSRICK